MIEATDQMAQYDTLAKEMKGLPKDSERAAEIRALVRTVIKGSTESVILPRGGTKTRILPFMTVQMVSTNNCFLLKIFRVFIFF